MNQWEEKDDQSVFSSTQEDLLAPPETILSPEEQVKADKVHKKRTKILVFGGGGILVLVILAVTMGVFLKTPEETIAYPTPTPRQIKNFTKMEEELSRLEYTTNLANPAEDTLPPPPVAEKVEI